MAGKVKQLDFAPQAEAATVEKMVAAARKGLSHLCASCVERARLRDRAGVEPGERRLARRAARSADFAGLVRFVFSSAVSCQAVASAAQLAVKRYVYLGGCPRDYSAACPSGWSAGSVIVVQTSCVWR